MIAEEEAQVPGTNILVLSSSSIRLYFVSCNLNKPQLPSIIINHFSGFEHVFLGEIKKGKVSGFHDWIYFYQQEKKNAINYLGYIDKANFNKVLI